MVDGFNIPPVKYPNGGGLKNAQASAGAIKKAETDALTAKHALEWAKLNEKHSKTTPLGKRK
ncbi:hypothetical protein UFOVP46_16 [uncultured Caudovirales phage]|uniref:Uncharacterized protein n=1 Tax=uncultured Caudovirales phage TaxID=2100421 RepID=A0A6J5KTF5_9CAUD|nr:hypothetical protein UFOVP46_16 [uncultured Caudovirales phage]